MLDLEDEKNRSQKLERTVPFSPEEADSEAKRVIDDYKFKLQVYEQDINTLQTNVSSGGQLTLAAVPCTLALSETSHDS
jgi:hypothetical protein